MDSSKSEVAVHESVARKKSLRPTEDEDYKQFVKWKDAIFEREIKRVQREKVEKESVKPIQKKPEMKSGIKRVQGEYPRRKFKFWRPRSPKPPSPPGNSSDDELPDLPSNEDNPKNAEQ